QFLDHLRRRVSRLPRRATFYFVGDFDPAEPYARDCLHAVARGELGDRVHFVGFTEDVASWYQSLDVVMLPSREEGLARSMIESVACGTPVVAFDVCSAREILEDHRCGIVVRQGDFDGLLDAVATLAGDRPRCAVLGAAGPLMTRRLFAPDFVGGAYERI